MTQRIISFATSAIPTDLDTATGRGTSWSLSGVIENGPLHEFRFKVLIIIFTTNAFKAYAPFLQLPPRHSLLNESVAYAIVATFTAAMYASSLRLSTAPYLQEHRTFNATLVHSLSPPDTYWANYNLISEYNVHLNFFEKLWAAWYAYLQNDVLATGIMSFVSNNENFLIDTSPDSKRR